MSQYGTDAIDFTPLEDRVNISANGSKTYDSNVSVDIGSWPSTGLRHQDFTIVCNSGMIRVFWRGDVDGTVEDVGEFTLQAGESFSKNFGIKKTYPDQVRVEEDNGNPAEYVMRLDKV